MDYTDIYSNLNLNYRHCCLGCKPRKLKLSDLAQKVLNDSDFLVIEYEYENLDTHELEYKWEIWIQNDSNPRNLIAEYRDMSSVSETLELYA